MKPATAEAIVNHGFAPLPSEWWTFDSNGYERFPLMDLDLLTLASGSGEEPHASDSSPRH